MGRRKKDARCVMHTNASKQVLIIGAGIAGIATAIRLRVEGFQVKVIEKNSYPGGKLSSFKNGDFSFDAGPSLFTQPHFIEELFDLAKEDIGLFFSYHKEPITCNYFYEDGTVIKAYSDKKKLAEELYQKTGEPITNINRFLQSADKLYNNIGNFFLQHSLHRVATLFKKDIIKALATVRPRFIFESMNSFHEKSFQSSKLVQLFNRYATYNGSNPYKAPSMLSMIPHLEFNIGTFYPKGGMISITNALVSLAEKKGVIFMYNQHVDEILIEKNKVSGALVGGKKIDADIIVSNMDAYFTYKYLLKDNNKAKQILKQERSSSAVIFYWGLNKSFPQLGLHNIFFSSDYKKEFDHLFNSKQVFDDPTIYINITAKPEPGLHAPVGMENWFVMVNAPAHTNQVWDEQLGVYREHIIKKLNRMLGEDIKPHIVCENILTPAEIEQKTASYAGSLYGTSSNSKMAAFLRHPNFSSAIKNLFFVGGSVHPGGGIPLCLQSAKITASIIANHE
ncbi:MAG: 1-hydroxycarotenoid 3,4-desaturase CrtD [Sediminibacterium sp.]|jgi:phytoene desaturase